MLGYVAAAIAGFVVLGFAALLLAGSLWPSLPYEQALPGLLLVGLVGALGAMALLRTVRARLRRPSPR